MPSLRRLSGAEIVAILVRFGFMVHSQRGSHVKLRRVLLDSTTQTLTVPAHLELDTGTCRAILRQASRFIQRHIFGRTGTRTDYGRSRAQGHIAELSTSFPARPNSA
jgi:predicted RNA binding protein YcfA (HicA-like mRNA interferase family)